jgi:hypothetical protein
MLLDHNIVADGEAKAGPFSGGFRREKGLNLLLHLGRNASAIFADPDLHAVPEVLGRGSKWWLVPSLRLATRIDDHVSAGFAGLHGRADRGELFGGQGLLREQ